MIETLDPKFVLAALAVCISASNLIYYSWSVIKKNVIPHAFTWVIWGTITIIAFFAQLQGDGGYALFHLGFIVFGCFIIASLGFLKGRHLITKSDTYCLAGCFIAVALWFVTGNPYTSVLLVTLIDLSAFYPSVRKSWNNPYNENHISFFLYGVCFSLQIAAIHDYNFLTTFYPICIAVSAYAMGGYLTIRRMQIPQTT